VTADRRPTSQRCSAVRTSGSRSLRHLPSVPFTTTTPEPEQLFLVSWTVFRQDSSGEESQSGNGTPSARQERLSHDSAIHHTGQAEARPPLCHRGTPHLLEMQRESEHRFGPTSSTAVLPYVPPMLPEPLICHTPLALPVERAGAVTASAAPVPFGVRDDVHPQADGWVGV
jgi:hypothetical protein